MHRDVTAYDKGARGLVATNTHPFTQQLAEDHGYKMLKTVYLHHVTITDSAGQKEPQFPRADPSEAVRYYRLAFDDHMEGAADKRL